MKPSGAKNKEKKSTVSVGDTPVQRALSRSNGYILLALFVIGVLFGIVYKSCSRKHIDQKPPDAVVQQR